MCIWSLYPTWSLLSTPTEHAMAVSQSLGAGSLFGRRRQDDEKDVKIEDEGTCSPLYAE